MRNCQEPRHSKKGMETLFQLYEYDIPPVRNPVTAKRGLIFELRIKN